MSKEHPGDNAQSRFTAFWMAVAAFAVFVIVLSFLLCMNSGREDRAASAVEDVRAEKRFERLAVVMKEQQALVNESAVVDEGQNLVRIPVEEGMKLVLPVLQGKKAGPSKIVVPGSPTSLKQSQVKPAAAGKETGAKASEKKQ